MAKKLRAMFDNTVGNVIKSGQQIKAEREISDKKRLISAAQEINKSSHTGKAMSTMSVSKKQDIANVLATAGKKRNMRGRVKKG